MEAWRGERPREETDRQAGSNSLGLPTQITQWREFGVRRSGVISLPTRRPMSIRSLSSFVTTTLAHQG